jgi:hypothetical protein
MAYKIALADSAQTDADGIYSWVTSAAPGRGAERTTNRLLPFRLIVALQAPNPNIAIANLVAVVLQ